MMNEKKLLGREFLILGVGLALGLGLMLGVFALLKKFDLTVLWGGLAGVLLALLNFFLIEDRVVFVDAPGYGYARGGDQSARVFGRLMEPYFRRREQLKAMVIVLDIRRTPSPEDIQMVEYAKQAHLAILGACTKADKLSNNQIAVQLKIIAETLGLGRQNLIPCSTLKKTGIEAVEARIEEYLNH